MKSYPHSVEVLPEGFEETLQVDLQKNKKLMILVNALAIGIAAVLVVLGLGFVPFSALFDMEAGIGPYALRFGVLVVGLIVYIIAHEWVHGLCMKYYSPIPPKFGFTGMYAFAGSTAYFDKHSYIVIALAPVVVWGLVLAVVQPFVSDAWFWVVYIIQINNLSGAAGDLYVTVRFAGMRDFYVQDLGTSMKVFERR